MTSSVPGAQPEPAGPERPERAARHAGENGGRHDQGRRGAAEQLGDEGGADGTHIELPLRADVEEARSGRRSPRRSR